MSPSAIIAVCSIVLSLNRFFLVLFLLALFLGGELNWDSHETGSDDLQESSESLIRYWRDTGLTLDQANQFMPLKSCSDKAINIRTKRACQMALLRLQQICKPEAVDFFSWTGVERVELMYLESQKSDLGYSSSTSFRQIEFEALLNRCSADQRPYALAMSVNSYLSIKNDPHSYLLPIKYFEEVISKSETRSNPFGLTVKRNSSFHWVVTKVALNGSAQIQRVAPGDRLLELQEQSIEQYSPKKISEILSSKRNINVLFERIKANGDIYLYRVQLRPLSVQVPNVSWSWADENQRVGLIRVEKFSRRTCDDFKKALHALKAEAMRGLVLDLRDNPGGSVDEASCVMDTLIKKGQLLFYTFDQKGHSADYYYSRYPPIFLGGVAILINQGSASASEIVAGGLQSLGRAKVVGQVSFGKGTYQDGAILDHFPPVAYFETRGYYLFADGRTTQLAGVIPDVAVTPVASLNELLREKDLYAYPLAPHPKGYESLMTARNGSLGKADSALPKLNQDCLEVAQNLENELQKAVEVIACEIN